MSFVRLVRSSILKPLVTEPAAPLLPPADGAITTAGADLRAIVAALYGGRSLRIRAVDAGSTNAEEIELTALGNAYYDIERFGLSFVASPRHADILMVTGPVVRNLGGAVVAVIYANIARDIKRVLAWSSVENLGLDSATFGVSALAAARGQARLASAVLGAMFLHLFAHALFKSGLFLGAGAIVHGTHTAKIEDLGGLANRMPRLSAAMLGLALAAASLPPFGALACAWLVARVLAPGRRVRRFRTWDCGQPIDATMEYTATGFSAPLRFFLRDIVTAEKHLVFSRVHPENPWITRGSMDFRKAAGTVERVYLPVAGLIEGVGARLKLLQNGVIQFYVALILVTLMLTPWVAL